MIRAKEACRFAGKNYSAGEVVPELAIDKRKISALVDMEVIELIPDPPPPVGNPPPKPKTKKQMPKPKVDGLKLED